MESKCATKVAVAFGASCEYRVAAVEKTRRPAPSAEGKFAKTPFAHVLLYIREHQLSGSLAIDGPANGPMAGEHFFVFEHGALAQTWIATGVDRLGDLLVDLKLVAAAHRADAEVILAAEQALVGEVFVEMGLVQPDTIPRVLREQNKRRTQRVFTLGNASYRFYQDVDLLQGFGGDRYALDVLGLVWRGVSSSPPHATIDQTIAKLGIHEVKLKDAANLALFEFERDVDPLLHALQRGSMTAEKLQATAQDPQLARTLIYVLLTSKQAEIVQVAPPELDDELPLPPPPQSPGVVHRAMSATPWMGLSRPMTPPETRAEPTTPAGPIIPPPLAPRSAVASPAPSASNTASAKQPPPRPTAAGAVAPDFRKTTPMKDPAASAADHRKTEPTTGSTADNAVTDALRFLAVLDEQTYFEMLGVAENVGDDELGSTFMKLASKWHPDRAPSPTAREAFQRVFSLINEAHMTLSDPKARERYAKIAKDGGGTPAAQKKVAQLLEASSLAQRAEIQLRRKEFADAEKLAREAFALNPTDPAVLAVLGLILFERGSAEQLVEALTILTQAVAHAPKNDKAQVTLGHVLKRKGENKKAIHHYRLALEANPKNVDAQRELRIAEMRARNPQAPAEPSTTEPPAKSKDKESENLLSKFLKR